MAYRVLALALLLVAFSSGEIHDATENLPNAGDSVELLSESTAAPEAHASPDGKGAEKVNEKGAATEEEAPGTTINEVNKEAAAATEEEPAATTTTNQVNEKAAATEEEAAATTTNNEVNEKAAATEEEAAATTTNEVNEKATATEEEAAATTTNEAPVMDGNVGEVTEIKTTVKMKTAYDPNSTPCPSGFTMQSKTDLGFTTGGHTTQAHGWLCKCSSGCGCVDGDNKPAILTAHVDGSSNTNGISTSNYNTLVDTLQSKVNSFVTTQREAGINSQLELINSEERARLGEGVQDRLGSAELKLTTFIVGLFKSHWTGSHYAWNVDLVPDGNGSPAFLKVEGHYDWKWNGNRVDYDTGINENGRDEVSGLWCPLIGQKAACFVISVVNPDPFYGTSGMEFKRDDLEAVVNECLQADTIGGYKVLQALKLVGTSGNDDFIGTRKGFLDVTNGLPGTYIDDMGTSTAKGMVINYWLKVDGTPLYTDSRRRSVAAAADCNNAKWRIEGGATTSAYVCQVKAVVTLWRRSGDNICSASTTPMVKVHAEVDHTQDDWYTMYKNLGNDYSGRRSTDACPDPSARRRRRGPDPSYYGISVGLIPAGETFLNLQGAYIGNDATTQSCRPSAESCRAVARKVDLHVRQKLNAARFDMVKDCSSDRRRRRTAPSYRTTQPPTPSPPLPACCYNDDGCQPPCCYTQPPTPSPPPYSWQLSINDDDD